ncbi:unnamed protein product [Hydatigera taeniaeformis]|uniref:G_PROTEIN_RECEP_F1_2 domain-containing protein n=1 Tax=Hydatigena taeniaeformis TaxID=6205 RepID=A0A0R3X936_HYDTA|nr:unnamed protein product [Hydatigera taeniaeformis]
MSDQLWQLFVILIVFDLWDETMKFNLIFSLCKLTCLMHMGPDRHGSVHAAEHNNSIDRTTFMEADSNGICGYILLCLAISSLLENVSFVLLTIRPLHRLCYLRRRRKKFAFLARTRANITSLAYSLQSTVMSFPTPAHANNTELGVREKNTECRQSIPHPIPPYHRNSYRNRCISAESSDICRYYKLHRSTFYYFCSLCTSITFFMCATLANILIEFQEYKGRLFMVDAKHKIQCLFVEVSITALVMVMSFSLVQLTTDRLIAICRPFHYWRIMSSWKCLLVIGLGWFTSIVFALIPYICLSVNSEEWTKSLTYCFVVGIQGFKGFYLYAYVYIALVFLLPLCFILWGYAKIHGIVCRSADVHAENHARYRPQANEANALLVSALTLKNHHTQCHNCNGIYLRSPSTSARGSVSPALLSRSHIFGNFSSMSCSQEGESREGVQCLSDYLKKAKAAKSAVLIVSSFYGLTLPYMCVICYRAVMVGYTERKSGWVDGFEIVSILLVYAATITTPVIYAIRDGALRKRLNCFFRTFKLLCAKKNIPRFSQDSRNINFLSNNGKHS